MARQDDRRRFLLGLSRARRAAFPPGEYVGQESFMTAGEIRVLAQQAGIGRGVAVLDLCCGIAGPGRLVTAELACRYLGIDHSASALEVAAELAGDLPCRFHRAEVPPLPDGPFQVVLLLETMLAFGDKAGLTREVAGVLEPGGRFAFTVEEGRPLTAQERTLMPHADTVNLIEPDDLAVMLREAGFDVRWRQAWTLDHQRTAAALLAAFRDDAAWIRGHVGTRAYDELIAAHELWCRWLGSGRVRKHAVVAELRAEGGGD